MKENLVGKSLKEVTALLEEFGGRPFQAKQLFSWLYQKGAGKLEQLTELSKELRGKLAERYRIGYPELVAIKSDKQDGARKFLLSLDDGARIECVYLPQESWGTLCVSSQVGCACGCTFCATGAMGFKRNLTTAEIVGQLLLARFGLGEKIDRIVVMGMGEPLDNLEQLRPALKIITAREGIGMSQRKITVSTLGKLQRLQGLVEDDVPAALAISLAAADNRLRWRLMPAVKGEKLSELIGWCISYQNRTHKELTIEYVMLDGVNDSLFHAGKLHRLLGLLECKVNLIPYNQTPGQEFRASSEEAISKFQEELLRGGLKKVFRRRSIGAEIGAACGQLATGGNAARATEE
jgi:23S rRNA (adenine2503-C2)-methyltransferase